MKTSVVQVLNVTCVPGFHFKIVHLICAGSVHSAQVQMLLVCGMHRQFTGISHFKQDVFAMCLGIQSRCAFDLK